MQSLRPISAKSTSKGARKNSQAKIEAEKLCSASKARRIKMKVHADHVDTHVLGEGDKNSLPGCPAVYTLTIVPTTVLQC
jgi:hypothetical protein